MIRNNNLILNEIFRLFKLNILEVNINKIGNSANLIYDLQDGKDSYILRISNRPFNDLSQYEAEMDYVNYLFNMRCDVSKVIPSINNKLVETIYDNNECHFVSVFEKAKGHLPKIDDTSEWNESLFYKWGKTMGKIHSLTKDYKPKKESVTRKQWDEWLNSNEGYVAFEKDCDIYNIWTEIINEMNTFSKDKNSYGLIHNDLHQYNFFIYDDKITVFDYDDCVYHWYILDIAIAIYHSLQTVSNSDIKIKREFGIKFIENFLKGYLKENKIEEKWLDKIPFFLEYRRLFSYDFVLKMWREENLTDYQKEYLKNIRQSIKDRVPYIDINFKELIKDLNY